MNPKVCFIIYHKNVQNYNPEWIKKCVESIQKQTYKEFEVFELDYGNTNTQIYPDSHFSTFELDNHALAHNYLLDEAFKLDFDYVCNVNVDDWFSLNRLEVQMKYMRAGFDVISSNFYNIDSEGRLMDQMWMSNLNLIEEANKGHNILAHPVLAYSRNFWTTCTKLDPDEVLFDYFKLWRRSFDSGNDYKFAIAPEFLLHYRIHNGKVSKQNNS